MTITAGRSRLPSLALLSAHQGQPVLLHTPAGETMTATLSGVAAGRAMSEHYHCYSAEFELGPDTQLPQAVYQLRIGDACWPLLMTPVGLGTERRGRLQAIVHARREAAPEPQMTGEALE
jgi:hypothetical protein